MKPFIFALAVATALAVAAAAPAAAPQASPADIARGRYLVVYGDCNSCHTAGWLDSDGTVPQAQWLTGNTIGFTGPWGTVYPTNLRLRFQQISEAQWLFMVHTRGGHPPMKWTSLRGLTLADQRAIYRFVRSLGSAGVPAPNDLPPGREPATEYFDAVPHLPDATKP